MTVVTAFILSRLSRQHSDFGARLLDELLQVNLPQLLGQLLQLMLHVLQLKQQQDKVICQETVKQSSKSAQITLFKYCSPGRSSVLWCFLKCFASRNHYSTEPKHKHDYVCWYEHDHTVHTVFRREQVGCRSQNPLNSPFTYPFPSMQEKVWGPSDNVK